MKIYNLLFYASYKLAEKSGNFNDIPVLGGIVMLLPCVGFNLVTIGLLLEGFHIYTIDTSGPRYSPGNILFVILLMAFLLLYYKWHDRYKQIVAKYDSRKTWNPWLIVIIYSLLSGFIMFMAAFFETRVWIFRDLTW
jgi:hypothetical protein